METTSEIQSIKIVENIDPSLQDGINNTIPGTSKNIENERK